MGLNTLMSVEDGAVNQGEPGRAIRVTSWSSIKLPGKPPTAMLVSPILTRSPRTGPISDKALKPLTICRGTEVCINFPPPESPLRTCPPGRAQSEAHNVAYRE